MGLAVDAAGDLLVADSANNRVRRIESATGIISTIVGGARGYAGDCGVALSARLSSPAAVDAAGNLFIADTYNNRIRRVDSKTGIITTVVGNGVFGSRGDNGPALSASCAIRRP